MKTALISTDRQLSRLLPELGRSPWVALDTEADSLYSYPEQLCLIQLSIEGRVELIDPLASIELRPLWEALEGRELILHGADFDLRLLRKTTGFVPARVFDTMIAARLVGERTFGLSALLEKHVGPKLTKSYQKANWSERPLPEKLIDYAAADAAHLKPLADVLRSRLEALGRLPWHEESCVRLVADCAVPPTVDPDKVWRIKGSARLGRPGLCVLRALWHWREDLAIRANKPPYFVMSHEQLVALARGAQHIPAARLRLPKRLSEARKRSIREIIARSLETPASTWPERATTGQRSASTSKDAVAAIRRRRDRRARELGIDPTLIASRAVMESLARDWESAVRELMAWQLSLLEPSKDDDEHLASPAVGATSTKS